MCITQFVAEIALFRPPLYYAVRYFKLKKKKKIRNNRLEFIVIFRMIFMQFHRANC